MDPPEQIQKSYDIEYISYDRDIRRNLLRLFLPGFILPLLLQRLLLVLIYIFIIRILHLSSSYITITHSPVDSLTVLDPPESKLDMPVHSLCMPLVCSSLKIHHASLYFFFVVCRRRIGKYQCPVSVLCIRIADIRRTFIPEPGSVFIPGSSLPLFIHARKEQLCVGVPFLAQF